MSDSVDIESKVVSIADFANKRKTKSDTPNPLADPNMRVLAFGQGRQDQDTRLNSRYSREYAGIGIPHSSALYDESEMMFGDRTVAETLESFEKMDPQESRNLRSSMEQRLLRARTQFITTNISNGDKRREEIRSLADHTWGIASEQEMPELKDEVSRLLVDTFGPSRAGKILERMSTVSNIQREQDKSKVKKTFRVIK